MQDIESNWAWAKVKVTRLITKDDFKTYPKVCSVEFERMFSKNHVGKKESIILQSNKYTIDIENDPPNRNYLFYLSLITIRMGLPDLELSGISATTGKVRELWKKRQVWEFFKLSFFFKKSCQFFVCQ